MCPIRVESLRPAPVFSHAGGRRDLLFGNAFLTKGFPPGEPDFLLKSTP